ncbi:CDP-diacylglycerol--glycerol-3-phosphate 3-phosphatidyltransferase [Parasphingorhabdus pacifica]
MTAESAASGPAAAGGRNTSAVPLLNIANVLTMSRLVLVPFFLLALLWDDGDNVLWRWVATAVFLVASITDRIDGDLARKRGLVTEFGKIADPIADKALTGAALIGLSLLGDLSWWITGVIIARELLVTLLRFWVIRHGVIPASRGGKLKALLQAVAIGLYLVPLGDGGDLVRWTVMGAAVLATVATGLDYVVRAVRLRAVGRRARKRHDS